jgi:hypothetical protein
LDIPTLNNSSDESMSVGGGLLRGVRVVDTRGLAATAVVVRSVAGDTKSLGDTKLSCNSESRVEGEGSFFGRPILRDIGGVLKFGVITCRLDAETRKEHM